MHSLVSLLVLLVPLTAFAGGPEEVPLVASATTSNSATLATSTPRKATSSLKSYRLDPTRSKLYARLYKAGVAGAFAHDHVIEARTVSGEADLDPTDLAHSSVRIDVSVTGLYPDSDEMRTMLDLPKTLSDRERSEITDHLRSKVQLWADEYDKITFRSTTIEAKGSNQWQVTGDFTLRGVTHSISLPMNVSQEGDGIRARGQFHILQSDYGYEPYTALLGAIQNQDPADVVIDAHLVPR